MATNLDMRMLARGEIEAIWTIDRRELIERIYVVEGRELRLKPDSFDARGWPPGEAEKYTPLLYDIYDRGGVFAAVFDGARLVGVAVTDPRRLGPARDLVQLAFLHVSYGYRDRGVGARLFRQAQAAARTWGARGLYISATPSEHTIRFYQRRGCVLTPQPDPTLFALEPDDIHLECGV